MKKGIFVILASAIIFAGCQSKEEKAAELIKNELSKTLYDFESYQPIETIVKEANSNAYNDSACWMKAATLGYGMQQIIEYKEKSENAKEHRDIWGKPTYYSSSYSDNQYYKYNDEYIEALRKVIDAYSVCKTIAMELKDSVAKLDTTQIIGWEVTHRFRCKTKGGNSAIGDYRYIIDKDFKKVILCEDTDSEIDKHTREAIESTMSGYWDDTKEEKE